MRTFTLAVPIMLFIVAIQAQPQTTPATGTAVPRLIRVSSLYHPANGSAPAGVRTVTLAVYAEESGGSPLWQETQNVSVDADGHYSLLLGSTRNQGFPAELFESGEPRWLGVTFQQSGEVEQPRVLLASVPYALKAADAETLGGQPLSAFVLANPLIGSTSSATTTFSTASKAPLPRISSGAPNYIGQFVNTTDLGNSVMYDNAGKIGLGTTNPLDYMHVAFNDGTGVFTGYAVQNLNGGSNAYSGMLFYDQNGALGQFQGFNNSTHEYRINNIAKTGGVFDGSINFMLGSSSKLEVQSDGNVAITGNLWKGGAGFLHSKGGLGAGYFTLSANTLGFANAALGDFALSQNTYGSYNTAVGASAMLSNLFGTGNIAVGYQALKNATGNYNIALGTGAGLNTNGSNNIVIANNGVSGEANTIRIGNSSHVSFFAAGIDGVLVNNQATVIIDTTSGQLGTVPSSRRYKEAIEDMGGSSTGLLKLRPVTFRYRKPYADGSKPIDYGLIAEEVVEVYPDLVSRNAAGEIETVQYHKLTPMLLNELQKQNRKIEELEIKLAGMAALESRLTAMEAQLSKLTTTATAGR